MSTQLVPKKDDSGLPPILAGNATPDTRQRVGQFFSSVASLFESWVTRRKSAHTQRAYREDVMSFVRFMGIEWPDQATALFSVSVRDVLSFREELLAKNGRAEDHQPAHFLAVEFLQVPGGCRGRDPPAYHRAQPGARSVHLPRVHRSARRRHARFQPRVPAS